MSVSSSLSYEVGKKNRVRLIVERKGADDICVSPVRGFKTQPEAATDAEDLARCLDHHFPNTAERERVKMALAKMTMAAHRERSLASRYRAAFVVMLFVAAILVVALLS